jgi:hypothetical protein
MREELDGADARLPAAALHNVEPALEALERWRHAAPARRGPCVLVVANCCRYDPAAEPGRELQTYGCDVGPGAGGAVGDAVMQVGWGDLRRAVTVTRR